MGFDVFGRCGETFGIVFFASGQQAEKVTVGQGAKSFRAVAIVMQKGGRKGAGRMLAVFAFKPVECGRGNAF